jgi:GNAT superfamily N-acetyltransferase
MSRFDVEIREESISNLPEHGKLPIAFLVERRLEARPIDGGLGGIALTECPVACPYLKDYDAFAEDQPSCWPKRWDVSRWGLISAFVNGDRAAGAVVAYQTEGLDMLEGRADLAVLWDIRVRPEFRRRGLGAALFRAIETWARERRCRWLKVETQDMNVAACRFYARQGCVLGSIHRFAYRNCPEEVQLIWYKELRQRGPLDTDSYSRTSESFPWVDS